MNRPHREPHHKSVRPAASKVRSEAAQLSGPLPDFLPGTLTLEVGTRRDYKALSGFHYLAGPPATFAAVRTVRYADATGSRAVAVGVLSWPTARSRGRERFFALSGRRYGELLRFANANLRTISRVVVHPQFRSLGLATAVVRALIDAAPTRWVEASARMGRAVPMFERAGMARLDPPGEADPIYYAIDRGAGAGDAP